MDNESTLKFQILVFHIATLVWALGWWSGPVIAVTLLLTSIKHGGPLTMYRTLKELEQYGHSS